MITITAAGNLATCSRCDARITFPPLPLTVAALTRYLAWITEQHKTCNPWPPPVT